MAQLCETYAPTWHRLAQPVPRREQAWLREGIPTRWVECGRTFDAVAITPVSLGLDALTAMRLRPGRGYFLIGDRVRDTLYVLVPSGTAAAFVGLPRVRVLSAGDHMLLPQTEDGTRGAHWIGPPGLHLRTRLVDPRRLAAHLHALTTADHGNETT
jgi:hypothetical protein